MGATSSPTVANNNIYGCSPTFSIHNQRKATIPPKIYIYRHFSDLAKKINYNLSAFFNSINNFHMNIKFTKLPCIDWLPGYKHLQRTFNEYPSSLRYQDFPKRRKPLPISSPPNTQKYFQGNYHWRMYLLCCIKTHDLRCSTRNIYLTTCTKCKKQYVGLTKKRHYKKQLTITDLPS